METGLQRLLELYTWMQGDELGHKEFSFSCFNKKTNGELAVGKCGTVGCMLGEAPILWPEDWYFTANGEVKLRQGFFTANKSAELYFGLEYLEVDHLFYPTLQLVERYGGRNLSPHSSKQEVLENMKQFIERKYLQD